MSETTAKISYDGRLVIPANCRRELGLKPGDELVVKVENGEIHLISRKQKWLRLQEVVRKYAKDRSLLNELKLMRKAESQNEDTFAKQRNAIHEEKGKHEDDI